MAYAIKHSFGLYKNINRRVSHRDSSGAGGVSAQPIAGPCEPYCREAIGAQTKIINQILNYSTFLINRAGFPATIVLGATSLVTTEPAPTTAFSPTVTPGKIVAPAPIHALRPM